MTPWYHLISRADPRTRCPGNGGWPSPPSRCAVQQSRSRASIPGGLTGAFHQPLPLWASRRPSYPGHRIFPPPSPAGRGFEYHHTVPVGICQRRGEKLLPFPQGAPPPAGEDLRIRQSPPGARRRGIKGAFFLKRAPAEIKLYSLAKKATENVRFDWTFQIKCAMIILFEKTGQTTQKNGPCVGLICEVDL